MERRVEEAFKNRCNPVQEFAFAILRESVVAEPPTCAPSVPDEEREEPTASEDVATLASPFTPLP